VNIIRHFRNYTVLTTLVLSSGAFADLPTGDVVIEGDGTFPLANHNEIVEKLSAVDLEQTQNYTFELSGQTSVHLKFKKEHDTSGTFATRNEATNANTEIAYFNLARVLGVEKVFRATVPYTLESRGIATFRSLIQAAHFTGMRAQNARNIMTETSNNPNELQGCIKEKKQGEDVTIDSLADDNHPAMAHALFQDLKASNPKPVDGRYTFSEHYWAPRAKVARQYSLLMMMDTVFGQWDRYSGGNVVFRIVDDNTKEIELYSTDNGGADFWNSTSWAQKQASWFSRYDRNAIDALKGVYSFLTGRATSLRSVRMEKVWTDPKEFVVDMGLYYEKRPEQYVRELANNIGVLLKAVEANYNRYGEAVFF
jgi:hypothetical protein